MRPKDEISSLVWGPKYWFVLHSVAYNYPEHPNDVTKSNNKQTTINQLKKNVYRIASYFHNNIQHINSSKLFAGLVVITLNLASRFVTLRISKTMESYLKFTLSRDILVFCIVWMGSREIYIALLFTILFNFVVDYLLNGSLIIAIFHK